MFTTLFLIWIINLPAFLVGTWVWNAFDKTGEDEFLLSAKKPHWKTNILSFDALLWVANHYTFSLLTIRSRCDCPVGVSHVFHLRFRGSFHWPCKADRLRDMGHRQDQGEEVCNIWAACVWICILTTELRWEAAPWFPGLLDEEPSSDQLASLRRLFFEAHAMALTDVRLRAESSPDPAVATCKLPTAERVARQQAQERNWGV